MPLNKFFNNHQRARRLPPPKKSISPRKMGAPVPLIQKPCRAHEVLDETRQHEPNKEEGKEGNADAQQDQVPRDLSVGQNSWSALENSETGILRNECFLLQTARKGAPSTKSHHYFCATSLRKLSEQASLRKFSEQNYLRKSQFGCACTTSNAYCEIQKCTRKLSPKSTPPKIGKKGTPLESPKVWKTNPKGSVLCVRSNWAVDDVEVVDQASNQLHLVLASGEAFLLVGGRGGRAFAFPPNFGATSLNSHVCLVSFWWVMRVADKRKYGNKRRQETK